MGNRSQLPPPPVVWPSGFLVARRRCWLLTLRRWRPLLARIDGAGRGMQIGSADEEQRGSLTRLQVSDVRGHKWCVALLWARGGGPTTTSCMALNLALAKGDLAHVAPLALRSARSLAAPFCASAGRAAHQCAGSRGHKQIEIIISISSSASTPENAICSASRRATPARKRAKKLVPTNKLSLSSAPEISAAVVPSGDI